MEPRHAADMKEKEVATVIATIDRLPTPEAKIVGRQIHDLEFEFRYFDAMKLPDMGRRVQVRDSEHLASSDVNKYALEWQRGAQFPPVIVTADGFLADGAHRVGGAFK